MDLLLLSIDLDLLLPRALGERVRDLLLRAGERDLDRRILVRDLEDERFRRVVERERDRRRRPGLRDFDLRFFLSDGDRDALFLTGDLDLMRGKSLIKHYTQHNTTQWDYIEVYYTVFATATISNTFKNKCNLAMKTNTPQT